MFSGFMKHAEKSLFARGFKTGVGETFGFQYKKQGAGAARSYTSQGFMGRGAKGGIRANWMGNAAGLAFVGYDAYQGYKEGGMVGAAKNITTSAISWGLMRGAWNMAAGTLGSVPVAIGAAAVGGAYGYYRMGEAGQKYSKNLKKLEFRGADIGDTFGTMATMRQRSLSAIQNSHVNGRMALGGEAAMMHTTYLR